MESATQDPRTIYSLRLVALKESLLMSSRNSILPSTRKTVSRRKPSSRTRPAPRVSSFLMLPLEVLTEILPRLDWTSVLQLRQTCRYFYLVYKQHIIWTALVDRYIKSLPNPSRLDAPYSAYSPEELEKYFLRRLSAKNAWDSLTPHVRTVHCDMGSHLFHLLPGAVAGFVIISADATLGEVLQMAVDVDYKSSFLSFRLVLCPNLEQSICICSSLSGLPL
ncbi:hypothetical protein BDN72DRAFT_419119 [Pluteus cervinus]|uniref:Uncharacterized protein n=1 Tax=Pluteus cervinus TaxID=181527 RepID=A0ACD3A7T5_9AGAR|nr:hypothetical protein BDN72DRAFT_419119 [Pluteus cervinus]